MIAYKPFLYTGMGHLPYPNTFDWDFKENESHLERKQVSRKEKLIREFIFLIFGETWTTWFLRESEEIFRIIRTRVKSLVIDFLCFLWAHGDLYQRTTMVSMVTKFQTWETAGESRSGKDGWCLSAKKLFLWWGKMVLPFERQPLLHKRYATLSSPDLSRSFSEENEDSARGDEYAAFLKWATFFCLRV